jgi:hypothetical protein
MRFQILLFLSLTLINCASRKGIQKAVEVHVSSFPLRQLEATIPDSMAVKGIQLMNGFGLPAHTEVVRAGFFMLPLLFYNHFQASYQVMLGQDMLDVQWNEYVNKRLYAFANELERTGISNVQLEVKKALAHGKYISGHAYVVTPSYYYYNSVQDINLSRSKDATAEVALSLTWIDNAGNEQSRDASIKIQIAKNGMYSAQVRTLLGKTITLSKYDISFHFNHDIHAQPPYIPAEPMITVHLFRLSDLLVLGLDELCQAILLETRGEEVKPLPPSYSATLLQARTILWDKLKGKKIGVRFNRGYSSSGGPRSRVVYDFVSNKGQLTVDIGIERQKFSVEQYLFSLGQQTSKYDHLYFTPEEVLEDTDVVIEKIRTGLQK